MSYHLTLAGVVFDEAFQKCQACITELEQKYAGYLYSTKYQFFPT